MTITLVDDYLLIASDTITDMIANPGDYTKIEITGNVNCCTSGCETQVAELTLNNPFTSDPTLAEFNGVGLKIYPLFFGISEFIDGVYKFDIKTFGATTILEQNCAFVDMTFKCKVAALLKYIISENKGRGETEKIYTMAHLLHYSLFNGSNCGCNCEEMCTIFRELNTILETIDPQILTDCGC